MLQGRALTNCCCAGGGQAAGVTCQCDLATGAGTTVTDKKKTGSAEGLHDVSKVGGSRVARHTGKTRCAVQKQRYMASRCGGFALALDEVLTDFCVCPAMI